MKILLVAPTYLPSRRANTIQIMKMAQAAVDLGHHVRVLVPDSVNGKVLDWDDLANHYGIRSRFRMEWIPIDPRLRGYDYGVKAVRYFKRWRDADSLYTRLPQAAALGSLLNIPTIYEVHDLPGGMVGRFLYRCFLKGKGAHRLIIITKALQDAISKRIAPVPAPPFSIIAPDGVDLARYEDIQEPENARRTLGLEGFTHLPITRFTIGYTGHLYPGRGLGLIIQIASKLPQFSFLIVGGDPQAVRKLQAELDIQKRENVLMTGFVPNMDLPRYQAACDVLLLPYQRRVAASSGGDIGKYLSPMKLFEYLACGRAILSSNLPALTEVLNDSNSILLPPDDPNAWVAAIHDLKDDPDYRDAIASNARRDSLLYTWESRAARILSVDA